MEQLPEWRNHDTMEAEPAWRTCGASMEPLAEERNHSASSPLLLYAATASMEPLAEERNHRNVRDVGCVVETLASMEPLAEERNHLTELRLIQLNAIQHPP